jgi:hypothetical protein
MTQIGIDTGNWWLIYELFFQLNSFGKLDIFEEQQIMRPIALLRQQ